MKISRSAFSWAFYDWANSAFATTVMAAFFPLFFKSYWSAAEEVTLTTARLGWANSAASIVLAFTAPMLGAIADQGRGKKSLLFVFSYLGVMATCGLYFVEQGEWQLAVVLYVVANIGFAASNTFYDALMVSVANRDNFDFVSGLGYALGYLGGGLLLLVNVIMFQNPTWFGLVDGAHAARVSIVSAGIWWGLFSIPLFLWVREPNSVGERMPAFAAIRWGFLQLRQTVREVSRHRPVLIFLLAYFFYIDGVYTIIKMAIDYGLSLGFNSSALITALLLTQFIGFPAAIGFSYLGGKFGAHRAIFIGIAVYMLVTVWGFFMTSELEFYGLAATIGLVQGGVQALSRSFFASLIPEGQSGEFFGFYNMLGKFSSIMGPVLVGMTSLLTGNPRYSILSIIILFVIGAILLEVAVKVSRTKLT